MGRHRRLLERIRTEGAVANLPLVDLCALLRQLGFDERQRGSHHIFSRSDVWERIILQASGADAKPYQVRQVRALVRKYNLTLYVEGN